MRSTNPAQGRRGVILPVLAIAVVALCGFVALAVDIGMMAVARNQCQAAADLAALAGARSLDGSTSANTTAATTAAKAAGATNKVLSASISPADVAVQHGSYHYDTSSQTFTPQYPPVSPDTYNLTQSTVTHTRSTSFAKVIGLASFNVSATAVAAHRPRDVCVVLDFSGSMNDESDLWNNVAPSYTYLGTQNNSPNNTDTIVPSWGAYSDATASRLVCTSGDPRVGSSNVTKAVEGVSAIADDFYQHARGTSASAAFTAAPSSYATTPGGDYYLRKNNASGNPYAATYKDINNGSTSKNLLFDTTVTTGGYTYYYNLNSLGTLFAGYTRGPAYWGKTFFIWPPDPSNDALGTTRDWRGKFFMKTGGVYPSFGGPVNDNTNLYDASGNFLDPPGNYVINYKAILNWLKNTGTNPFPSTRLRAGRVLYYDQIPTDVPASAYDHTQANSAITDTNQRFWKEYIDYVLGVWRDPYGTIQGPGQGACSIAPDFTWGTVQIRTKPFDGRYMDYADNPRRPAHRFWFGPMTLIQYMSDTGLLPGTAHDVSLYPAKLGIAGALQDIQNNHPNDLASLILYSRPKYANDPSSSSGSFNQAVFGLNRNYQAMMDALWFPPNSSSADVRPWDTNGNQTPSADTDYIYNTAMSYGMMLAYNQLTANNIVQSRSAGGLGRRGAQRVIILETDGIANVESIPALPFANNGANRSYYQILPGQTINTSWTSVGQNYDPTFLYQTVQAICNKADGTAGTAPGYSPNPGYPGFATAAKPVLIHTIAFGAMFESASAGADQTAAVALLQQISRIGGTTFPSSSTDAANGYKWCTGDLDQRRAKLRQAFSKIMDDGVSVSLVQ